MHILIWVPSYLWNGWR